MVHVHLRHGYREWNWSLYFGIETTEWMDGFRERLARTTQSNKGTTNSVDEMAWHGFEWMEWLQTVHLLLGRHGNQLVFLEWRGFACSDMLNNDTRHVHIHRWRIGRSIELGCWETQTTCALKSN